MTPEPASPDLPDDDDLLRRCETEPIHIPGAVQPHGVLLLVDPDGTIVAASANASSLASPPTARSQPGRPDLDDLTGVLGRSLADLLGTPAATTILGTEPDEPVTVTHPAPDHAGSDPVGSSSLGSDPLGSVALDAITHRHPLGRVVELEAPTPVDLDERVALGRLLRQLQGSGSETALLDRLALAVRELTGFDRVMVYRFDEDWNGEVVAEAVDERYGAFLGLRYPASDIPPQARALYLRNRVRLIPAVDHRPVPLVARPGTPEPIDLSDATLRAVSPVHLEYLRNMGVAASMSAALVVDEQLWGLVACHHYQGPRRPSQRVRLAVDVMAGTASALLGGLRTSAGALARVALNARLDRLTFGLADPERPDLLDALADAGGELPGLLAADGTVVSAGRQLRSFGRCPPEPAVRRLLADLAATGRDELVTAHLVADLPRLRTAGDDADHDGGARDDGDHAAGADRSGASIDPVDPDRWLALTADAAGTVALRWGDDTDWVVWFRDEQVRSVRWGGDPAAKEVVLEPDGARLGPRHSFAEYVEVVRDRSRPWSAPEVDAARSFAGRLTEAAARRHRRDRAVAALMQRALLLDSVPAVPGADVAVLYEPAASSGLGGDWHDVYFLRDGRAVIALGDVAGHGMEVAATMAQVRHALRAYVMREADLADALGRLNELTRALLPGEMATAVVSVLDPGAGRLDVVNAGHLPPVLVGRDGAVLLDLPRQPALGLARSMTWTATPVALDRGATLVLCTDGLVERRTTSLDVQLDALVDAAGDLAGQPSQVVCRLLRDRFAPDGSDDVTVLALRLA